MNLENKPTSISQTEAIRYEIKAELKSFGAPALAEVLDHLIPLEQFSQFNDDARMICDGIRNILDFEKSVSLGLVEKKRLLLAAYLHDIGKSSSSEDEDCRLAVTKLFAVEGIKNTSQAVLETLERKENFPSEEIDVEEMLFHLAKVGVVHNMSMREFWDKHTLWTKDILDRHQDVFDEPTRKIAGSHHLYNQDINPYNIDVNNLDQVSNELKYSIFLLMAVDVYQALVSERRSNLSHQKAMPVLRAKLRLYEGDYLMEMIIAAIDKLGSASSLFPKKNASVAISE